jgi:aromatic ring hydroxylase
MGVRSGAAYLAGLRDDRHLYVRGQRVGDVTAFVPYRGILGELAAHYDRHCDGALAPALTFPSPADGAPVMNSWLATRSWDEMSARMAGERLRAERTYGQMGRLPDFMAAFITDLASVAHVLGAKDPAFAQNARRYHAECRDRDLALTHTLVDPQVDRSRGPEAQGALRIVRETDAGVVVRGARMLSTLAPVSDELYVGPYMPRRPGEEAFCLSFGVPVAHPGLKFVAREPYDTGAGRYDRPLSARFDEGDAIAIFEDALIPWERVFVAGDLAAYNAMTPNFPGYLALQAVIRGAAKLNFLVGVACKAARAVGRSELARYQELIGELIGYAELADGLIEATAREVYANAAQEQAGRVYGHVDGALFTSPERGMVGISAIRLFYTLVNPRAAEVVRLVASSGLVMTPTLADFENPEIAPALGEYLRGRDMDARERVQIMKLAWDAVGTEFGSRQSHYELFFAGDPVTARAVYWPTPRRERCEALVDRLLAESR